MTPDQEPEHPSCRCGTRMDYAGANTPLGLVTFMCPNYGRGHEYFVKFERHVLFVDVA